MTTTTERVQLHEAINFRVTHDGRLRVVCEFCGTVAQPVEADDRGLPDAWAVLERGWGMAPFPTETVHRDGSTGTRYDCPSCLRRMDRGERMTPRCEAHR